MTLPPMSIHARAFAGSPTAARWACNASSTASGSPLASARASASLAGWPSGSAPQRSVVAASCALTRARSTESSSSPRRASASRRVHSCHHRSDREPSHDERGSRDDRRIATFPPDLGSAFAERPCAECVAGTEGPLRALEQVIGIFGRVRQGRHESMDGTTTRSCQPRSHRRWSPAGRRSSRHRRGSAMFHGVQHLERPIVDDSQSGRERGVDLGGARVPQSERDLTDGDVVVQSREVDHATRQVAR